MGTAGCDREETRCVRAVLSRSIRKELNIPPDNPDMAAAQTLVVACEMMGIAPP